MDHYLQKTQYNIFIG